MQKTQETWVQTLGQEDPLEKETATHSSILAWEIPWTEEPGGLQCMGSQRVGRDWATNRLTQGQSRKRMAGWEDLCVVFLWLPLPNTKNCGAQATDICLKVLEAESQDQGVGLIASFQGLWRRLRHGSRLPSDGLLEVFGVPWCVDYPLYLSSCPHGIPFVCMSLSTFPLFILNFSLPFYLILTWSFAEVLFPGPHPRYCGLGLQHLLRGTQSSSHNSMRVEGWTRSTNWWHFNWEDYGQISWIPESAAGYAALVPAYTKVHC